MSFLGKLAITDGAMFGIGVSMLFAAGMAEAQRRRDYRRELRSSETPTRGERHFEVVTIWVLGVSGTIGAIMALAYLWTR